MRDRELYVKLLGIEAPWYVRDVDMRLDAGEVEIFLSLDESAELACPVCGAACSKYDARPCTWRHLDTMQYKTLLTAEVPRVNCPTHGVKKVHAPWAEPSSRFTALFEAVVIDWLLDASTCAVARLLRLTGDEVDGIRARAVVRGFARRELQPLKSIGIDETSFQKRHEYATVVYDCDRKNAVGVMTGLSPEALENFDWDAPFEHLQSLESISMETGQPFIDTTLQHLLDAEREISFDRSQVGKHIGDSVNKVRVHEHAELQQVGNDTLEGSRYLWLQNPENTKRKHRQRFEVIRTTSLEVARAWAMKEAARHCWSYQTRGWARRGWDRLNDWMARARLAPMVKTSRTLRDHLLGIIHAVVLDVTNAHLEFVNAKIQALEKRACGYRSRDRFRDAILSHGGGLDLYPRGLHAHTKAGSPVRFRDDVVL